MASDNQIFIDKADIIRSEEKEKEQSFLKQFNAEFEKYKKRVKETLYVTDQEELDRLTDAGQPKYIYTNFPLIIGIIFIVFGFLIAFNIFNSSHSKETGDTLVEQIRPSMSQIKPLPVPEIVIPITVKPKVLSTKMIKSKVSQPVKKK